MHYPVWKKPNGDIVSCAEKIKVMQQNIDELKQMAQDLFEDGILMDIDSQQLRNYLGDLMHSLSSPYEKIRKDRYV